MPPSKLHRKLKVHKEGEKKYILLLVSACHLKSYGWCSAPELHNHSAFKGKERTKQTNTSK